MESLSSFQPVVVQTARTKAISRGASEIPAQTGETNGGGETAGPGKETSLPFSSVLNSVPARIRPKGASKDQDLQTTASFNKGSGVREEPESTEEASLVSYSMTGPVPGWIDPEGASIGQTLQMTTVINDGSPIEKETERAKEASMAFSSTADPFPTWFGPGEALKDQSLQTISTFIDGLPKGKWTEPGKEASVVFSSVVQPFRTRIDPSGASVDQTLGSLSGLGLGQRNDGGSALSFSTHKGLLHPEALTSNMGSSFILPEQNLSSTKGFDGKEPFSLPENTDPKGDEDSRNINPTESAAGTSRERVSSLGREGIRPEIRTVLQSEQGPLGPEKGKIDSLLDAERLGEDPSAKSTLPEDKGSYDRLSAELKAASTPPAQDDVSKTLPLTGDSSYQKTSFMSNDQEPGLKTAGWTAEEVLKTENPSTAKFEGIEADYQIAQKGVGPVLNRGETIKVFSDSLREKSFRSEERGKVDSLLVTERSERDSLPKPAVPGEMSLNDQLNAGLKGAPTPPAQDKISESLPFAGDSSHQEASLTSGNQRPGLEMTAPMREEVPKPHDSSAPKLERLEVYQQIGQKVIWSVRNGQEKIKLTLDPPQLGNLSMEITKDKENIRTTIWADTPGAKGILESNQTQLHKLLRDNGFNLEKFDVFVQEGMGSYQEKRERWVDQSRRFQGGRGGDKDSSSHPSDITFVQANPLVRGSHYVDCFV